MELGCWGATVMLQKGWAAAEILLRTLPVCLSRTPSPVPAGRVHQLSALLGDGWWDSSFQSCRVSIQCWWPNQGETALCS